jgi:membrane fusion protein, multidrug efflux system
MSCTATSSAAYRRPCRDDGQPLGGHRPWRRQTRRRGVRRAAITRRALRVPRLLGLLLRAPAAPEARGASWVPTLVGVLLVGMAGGCRPDPAARQQEAVLPVQIETVRLASFRPAVVLLGVLRPGKSVTIRAVADGVVEYPRRFAGSLPTGAAVAAGEELATISNPGLDLALAESRLALQTAQSDLHRLERSFAEGLVPRVDLDRAQVQESLAEARLKHASIQASFLRISTPIAGRLVVLRAFPAGAQVARDTELAQVMGQAALQVEARAAENQLALLRPGLAARLRTAAGMDAGTAELSEVSPALDATGTSLIRARVAATPRGLMAGQGVEMDVALDERQAISLPEEALITTAGGPAVFVLRAGGDPARVQARPVQTGGRSGGRVEILDGLRPGERVAVRGAGWLTDGAAVLEEAAAEDPGRLDRPPPQPRP